MAGYRGGLDEKRVNVMENIRQMENSPLPPHSFLLASTDGKAATAILDNLFNNFLHRFSH